APAPTGGRALLPRARPGEPLMLTAATVTSAVTAALAEDAPWGDLTCETFVPPAATASAQLRARTDGVLAGAEVFTAAVTLTDPHVSVVFSVHDGARFSSGDVLAEVSGPAQAVLRAERIGLNFVQRMSGIATLTSRYVAEVAGTKARDRKSTRLNSSHVSISYAVF